MNKGVFTQDAVVDDDISVLMRHNGVVRMHFSNSVYLGGHICAELFVDPLVHWLPGLGA